MSVIMVFRKKIAAVLALFIITVGVLSACDGPFPQAYSGDDGWPMTGTIAACHAAANGYVIYVVHKDNTLWHYILTDPEEGSELTSPEKLMDGVRSVYWVGSSWRVIIHKLDGSLWLLHPNSVLHPNGGFTKISNGVEFVSSGAFQTLMIKYDGSLWELRSDIGSLNSAGTPFLSDSQGRLYPESFVMDDVKYASAGWDRSLIVKNDGSLYEWAYPQGEDGEPAFADAPVFIMGNAARASAGRGYSAVIDEDGGLWTWGMSGEYYINGCELIANYGKLGDGTGLDRSVPIKIMDGVLNVSTNEINSIAVKTDGSLWFWGALSPGLSENPAYAVEYAPVKVWDDEGFNNAGHSRYTRGVYGGEHNGAIKSDGSLWKFIQVQEVSDASFYDEYHQFSDSIAAVKIAEDVVFEYEGLWVKKDGSLWRGANYWFEIEEPGELLPPGTIAIP